MSQLPPILLVDDDFDDLFILKRLLAKAGVQNQVMAFEESVPAKGYLEAEIRQGTNPMLIPFLIITDLQMPRMNGHEFVEWARTQPKLAKTQIVMVSSSENPEHAARATRLGAVEFCLKYPSAGRLRQIVLRAGGTCSGELG